jgi:acrylyl-CoA reductase (NADPH)
VERIKAMEKFEAVMISREGEGQKVQWQQMEIADLMEGDVTVVVTHTTINYKDGLAITGRSPIIRRYPMIPGIDLAGVVAASSHPGFRPGEQVLATGWGLGESHFGGYAGYARLRGEWLVPMPERFSPAIAMAIGTAGFTAMSSVMALEAHGVTPEQGPVLVTGAAGGVGSMAVAILSRLGYRVVAATGRMEERGYLEGLGASDIMERAELTGPAKPLWREQWAGAIDTAGGEILANVLSRIKYRGTVAACGLAAGMELPTSVAPFILRGVTLAGISSVMAPREFRLEAWGRLARDLDLKKLESITTTRPLRDVLELAPEILAGRVRGRVVLEV